MNNPAMVFTTPDCRDAALAQIGSAASGLTPMILTGEALFGQFDKLGIDGMVLNMCGPAAPKALPLGLCQGIAQSIRDRAELARLEAIARRASQDT